MKTLKKIESYFSRIQAIRFENQYGGAYAYIEYLAYTRELLNTLRPHKKVERQVEAIDGICWLFNECLAFKFTARHKSIFDEKMSETQKIFDTIRQKLANGEFDMVEERGHRPQHAQAA